jgi:ankyrin repeat protein
VCQVLVSRGCPPGQLDVHKHSALHWACYMGRMQTAQYLINVGCSIHDKDSELRTPLHRAVQVSLHGHVPIVAMLLRMGAKVEVNEGNEDNDMVKMAKSSKGNVRSTSILRLWIHSDFCCRLAA